MQPYLLSALVVTGALLLPSPAAAQARGGQFEGFGGRTFGNATSASTYGGGVAVPIGSHVQLLGEAGHLSDLQSPLVNALIGLTPLDVGMSAWYAEGGIRFTGSRDAVVRPYVQATAGIARLRPGIRGAGAAGAVADAALGFLDQREPLVGAGAGIMLQGGPVLLDLGYRYKRILTAGGVASAFALGNAFEVNQLRVGVGVRF